MAGMHRLSTTAAVLVCFVVFQSAGVTLFASDGEPGANPIARAQTARLRLLLQDNTFSTAAAGAEGGWPNQRTLAPADTGTFASRRGLFWGRDRNQGARTAVILGTIGAITGAALLVYANRPECRESGAATGCGYGTKVVGGAVASAGLVGIVAGTLSWR